jgi:membrane protease YdiL (CAAX protease family)
VYEPDAYRRGAPHVPPGVTPPWWSPPDPRRWGLGDVGYGLLVAFGLQFVVGAIAVLASVDLSGEVDSVDDVELPLWGILLSIAAGWVGFIGWPLIATYVKGQASLARDFCLRFRPVDLGWGVLAGLAGFAVTAVMGALWQALSGEAAPDNSGFLPESVSPGAALLLFVAIAVVTPFAEELFFRGLLLRALEKRFNTQIAVVVSALVFGLLHFAGVTSASDLSEFVVHGMFVSIVITGYGLIFAFVVARTGRLAPSIIAHMLINGLGVVTYLAT